MLQARSALLPLVGMSVGIRNLAAPESQPFGEAGAAITKEVLRREVDRLGNKVAGLGATVTLDLGQTSTHAIIRAIGLAPRFTEWGADILAGICKADLTEEEFSRISVALHNESPRSVEDVAGDEMWKSLYGKSFRLDRNEWPEFGSARALVREHLSAGNIVLVTSAESVRPMRTLSSTCRSSSTVPSNARVNAKTSRKLIPLFIANRPNSSQTQFIFEARTADQHSPDWPAILIANYVLNRRLRVVVRDAQALSYDISSQIDSQTLDNPVFVVGRTKSGREAEFIASVLAQVSSLTAAPISKAELEAAKQGYVASIVLGNDGVSNSLNMLLTPALAGFDRAYWSTLSRRIRGLSAREFADVSGRFFQPGYFVGMASGNAILIRSAAQAQLQPIQVAAEPSPDTHTKED